MPAPMPIQPMPAPKPSTTVPTLTPSEEVAPSAPLQLEEAIEKKKKRAISKKVGRRVGSSESGGPDQEQASLDDQKVIQSLMKVSILLYIAVKMLRRGDVERFNESFAAYLENALNNLGHDSPLPVDADPLPRGVLIKLLIRSLKMEIHHLKKELRKIEDDLQKSRKNASEATIKVTHLRNLHRKDSTNFSIRKGSFEKEMAKLRRSASNMSWKLTTKISSLEINLTMVKEKI
ncbi:hypothetical protein COCNU_scaffold016396G000010 [Cocos nucifera]|nr:hypothetical protein [Cocos nucifera]